ncbi:MAG: CHAD domain-containing protein [Anaerolineae bacterium]
MVAFSDLTAEMPFAEAGRFLMAAELDTILAHLSGLQHDADETAVHETRKAIRRTLTAVKIFGNQFKPDGLEEHRRWLKKMMRRLAPCRDAAVFLAGLRQFISEAGGEQAHAASALRELERYWQQRKSAADERARRYVSRPQFQRRLARYHAFVHSPGAGLAQAALPEMSRVSERVPVVIAQKAAAVSAYENRLEQPTAPLLHQLRIRCKELRYTLLFFRPLLGPEAREVIAVVKQIQEHLGNLNDVDMALRLLEETAGCEAAVSLYRPAKEAEVRRLTDEFGALWAEMNSMAWRQKLAAALDVL